MIWVNLYCIVFAKVFSEEVSEIRSRDPPALRKAFPRGKAYVPPFLRMESMRAGVCRFKSLAYPGSMP